MYHSASYYILELILCHIPPHPMLGMHGYRIIRRIIFRFTRTFRGVYRPYFTQNAKERTSDQSSDVEWWFSRYSCERLDQWWRRICQFDMVHNHFHIPTLPTTLYTKTSPYLLLRSIYLLIWTHISLESCIHTYTATKTIWWSGLRRLLYVWRKDRFLWPWRRWIPSPLLTPLPFSVYRRNKLITQMMYP